MEFDNPKGIYLQIAEQVRERILLGEWTTGERIPSVREMAVEMGVNPNTVARSYQSLVDRGLIASRRGQGFHVTENASALALAEMRREFLEVELPQIAQRMRILGIGADEIAARLAEGGEPEGDASEAS